MGDTLNLDKGEGASSRLKHVLQHLNTNRFPHVPNPPTCKKRASVALAIRFRPAFQRQASWDPEQCSSSNKSVKECLDYFFDQDWVKNGEAEVLFIKRAERVGDPWTSHVALPGGRREPSDVDDNAASVRETIEETGLDLTKDYCLSVGNLPERVVTTAWGKTP